MTPYNRKENVLSVSLNKTFPSLMRLLTLFYRKLQTNVKFSTRFAQIQETKLTLI